MASEHIIISRSNEDGSGVIEQYPKTLSTVVYDVNNGQYLNETIEKLKQNNEANQVEIVDSLTSISPTSALSARQGKFLSDVDNALSNKIDILREEMVETITGSMTIIENRTSDPVNAEIGRIWLRTDL